MFRSIVTAGGWPFQAVGWGVYMQANNAEIYIITMYIILFSCVIYPVFNSPVLP